MNSVSKLQPGMPVVEKPVLSEAQRIVLLFTAPSTTFAALQQKASWVKPFLVICALSLLFIGVIDKKIGFTTITHNMMQSRPKELARIANLPPEAQQQAWDFAEKITKISSYATPVFILLIASIVSLVLWLVFLVMRAQLTFGKMFSIFMYSSLPVGIVKTVLLLILVFAGRGAENFRLDNPIGSNLGFFLNLSETPKFIYSLASSIDLFTIWTAILIGIGVACLTKVRRSTAIATVLSCWLIWAVIQGVFSQVFS